MKKIFTLFLLSFFLAGCSWFGGDDDDSSDMADSVESAYPVTDTNFDSVQDLMKQALKDKIVGWILEEEVPEKLETSTELELSVDYSDDAEAVKANLSITNQDKSDLSDPDNILSEGNLTLSGDVNYQESFFGETNEMDVSLEADLDYKLLGMELYGFLKKLEVSSSDELINQEINQQLGLFLTPWMDKWLKLDLGEIAQVFEEGSMMNTENMFKAWSVDYAVNQIERFFEPDLLELVEEKGEEDGFLVYEVALSEDGVIELMTILLEQSALNSPMVVEEMQREMRSELANVNLQGTLSVLKADAQQFKLDFDEEQTGDDVTVSIEWLKDRRTFTAAPSGSDDPIDNIFFEWLLNGDEGTMFFGSNDQSIKAFEGEYDDDGAEFVIYMDPEDWENAPKIEGELEEKNDVYSGKITIPEDEWTEREAITLNLDSFEFSAETVKMVGNVMLGNQEVLGIRLEADSKELDSVDIQKPEGEVESLTQTVTGFLGLMTMGMNGQMMAPTGDPFGGEFDGMEGFDPSMQLSEEELNQMMEEMMADPAMMEMMEGVEIPAE